MNKSDHGDDKDSNRVEGVATEYDNKLNPIYTPYDDTKYHTESHRTINNNNNKSVKIQNNNIKTATISDHANEKSFKVIIFSGIIGAGKSTLMNNVANKMIENGKRVYVAPEPVDKWRNNKSLDNFYRDTKRWGFTFQLSVLEDRLSIMEQAAIASMSGEYDIFITERSIYEDICFTNILKNNGDMSPEEYGLYYKMWDRFERSLTIRPDMFVYIRPNIETCMSRVSTRARIEETSAVSETYQKLLLAEYDSILDKKMLEIRESDCEYKTVPILKINNEFDITDPMYQNNVDDIITHITRLN